jgi:hypothetical protein
MSGFRVRSLSPSVSKLNQKELVTILLKISIKNHKTTYTFIQSFSLYSLVIFYIDSFYYKHLTDSHVRSRWFNPSTAYHEYQGVTVRAVTPLLLSATIYCCNAKLFCQ